ncbi:PAS domain S-box protein [Maridesulfovibrio hydrothermalis]|uniref:Sensory/regulatory protein RpfC n=1 Tax=Maridesulfovibrio hydrothermalis AM13 = DSM 14728 TaxID=1121451 RepID=L0RAL8_9BACT|nr:PAS domain S-box protein [Maridesulfovibrio hydrothermalis]CCO23799.1 PAS/PAC sensor hybrid histidine kinase [Maridesulfovibrio hydrothermalis AM13 = DSM 14728]
MEEIELHKATGRIASGYYRYRLVLVSALILFAALVGFALWTSYSSQLQVRSTARELFAGESAKRAMAVSFFFSGRVAELKNLASVESVRSFFSENNVPDSGQEKASSAAINSVCKSLHETLDGVIVGDEHVFTKIAVLDSSGRVLVDTDSECVLIKGNNHFEQYKASHGEPVFSTGDSGGVMTMVVSVPIAGFGGRNGTVAGWVRIESLHRSLEDMTVSPSVGSDFLRIGDSFVAISDTSARQSGQLLLMDALKDWRGLTVLKAEESGREVDYLAISSPVQGTSLSIISLVEEHKIFGFISLEMQLFITMFIFAAVASGCYFLVRIIFTRHIYETKVFEAAKREAAINVQKEKLDQEVKNRRLADALRKRAEIRYRDIFDKAPVGIFQIALDGRYLTANNALAKIFGYDSQEELVSEVHDVRTEIYADPQDWDRGLSKLRKTELVAGYEVKCKRKDGSFVWTSRDFRLVEAGPELPSYLEGFVIDITSRKMAEQELIGSEKRFRSLFQNSPVALWELDLSRVKDAFDSYGKGQLDLIRRDLLQSKDRVAECVSLINVLDINNLTIEFLGVNSREDLTVNGIQPYVTNRSWRFFRTILLDLVSGATRHRSEVQFIREDGKEQYMIVNCHIVPGWEKSWGRVLATIEDISELKRIENELRISKEEAQKANEAKGHFLANMSHEFRTPMSAIKGMVQLLQGSELSKEQHENLRLIKSSVDSLLAIVNDILDFSKLDSVHMELNEDNLELPSFLKEMRDIMDIGAMNKQLDVLLDIENIPACVKVDGLRLRQVLVNLLGNAIKFTDKGTVTLKCRTVSEVKPSTKLNILFEVADTGIGLPVEGVDSLFKSFVQADPTITRQYGGTGLGLAICYRLVKHLGGDLSACNNPSGGASFSFILPLEQCGDDFEDDAQDSGFKELPERADLSKVKVLVAEDSKMNQILLRKIFEKNGLSDYLIVENGKYAVDAFTQSHDFDIIFMDIQMPVMDGFEATRAIRKLHSPVRIVALTANSGEEYWEQCRECGMDSRITKPFNVDDLLDELSKIAAQS